MLNARPLHRYTVTLFQLLACLLVISCHPALAAKPVHHADAAGMVPHIMVVIEENRNFNEVIGSSSWPNLNALAQANGLATNYFAVAHPSLPNYLALLSGSTQGVTDDGDYTFPGPVFPDQLSSAGVSWRAYMEGLPSTGYGGTSAGNYAKKHDPFAYFSSITSNPAKVNNIVSTDQLGNDLANANGPAFMWVTPDLMDDAHDGPDSQADSYLGNLVNQIKGSAWWRNGAGAAIIVVFDESDTDNSSIGTATNGGGQVVCLVISNKGPQQYNGAANHYGLLRTLETIYGVSLMGDAGNSSNGNILPLMPSFQGGSQPSPTPQPKPQPIPSPFPQPKPAPSPPPVHQPTPPSSKPVIHVSAGANQAVRAGAHVALHGTFYAPGIARITYRWRQVSGNAVQLHYTGQGNAAFIAPNRAGVLTFILSASDGKGHTSSSLTHVRVLAAPPATTPARPSSGRPTAPASPSTVNQQTKTPNKSGGAGQSGKGGGSDGNHGSGDGSSGGDDD